MIKGLLIKPVEEELYLYNGDVKMIFNNKSHRYTVYYKGEKKYGTVGTTTCIGILDKPQLIQWSANVTSEAWLEGLTKADKIDEVLIHRLSKEAPQMWRVRRDSAGDIGTLIHAWIESYIKYKLGKEEKPELPENQLMHESVLKFLQWEKDTGITFTDTERKIYSLKHNIAGTCDFLYVTKEGKLGIGDIKTSKGIYNSFFYQVAAYRYMLEEERAYIEGKTAIPYEEMTIVRVGKDDGKLEVKHVSDYHEYAKGFLACSIIYRLNKKK